MQLKKKIVSLLKDADRMCDSSEGTEDLQKEISRMINRLNEPLRVAIAGIMKAGKSTFMNALLKEDLLFTGVLETTYVVSWFKYSPEPYLMIVFRDNTKERAPFEHLEKWTVRTKAAENPRLYDVKYIEIYYPNEILKVMELIDTPGLNSSHGQDSDNTLDFLGLKNEKEAKQFAKQLEEITIKEASQADAIIYAYTRSAGSHDKELLEEFHGNSVTSASSPINALGVFTKSDILWEPGYRQSPTERAQIVTSKIMKDSMMKRILYTTIPVTAKAVEGFSSLNPDEWNFLENLSQIDPETMSELLDHIPSFTGKKADEFDDDIIKKYIGTPEERKNLIEKLDIYGIYETLNCIRKGLVKEKIVEYLYEKCGLKQVNNLICSHFGNRSLLIKTQYIFSRLKLVCNDMINANPDSRLSEICQYLIDEIENIETTEHSFQELKVLQNYYNSVLKFQNEEEYMEFLQVTGEMGKNCEARLGVPHNMPIKELAIIARKKISDWHARGNDFGVSFYYEQAANIIAHSYEIISYHLDELLGQ